MARQPEAKPAPAPITIGPMMGPSNRGRGGPMMGPSNRGRGGRNVVVEAARSCCCFDWENSLAVVARKPAFNSAVTVVAPMTGSESKSVCECEKASAGVAK